MSYFILAKRNEILEFIYQRSFFLPAGRQVDSFSCPTYGGLL
jgi:hypothetical protein